MPFFFLKKRTKIQDSKMLPLPHMAFALQISQNHRAVPSCPASHPQPSLQPEANALSLTQSFLFCPISSGSGLLSTKSIAISKIGINSVTRGPLKHRIIT